MMKDVDGRDKPGHDALGTYSTPPSCPALCRASRSLLRLRNRKRPRIAHTPAAGFHQRDEAFDRLVEECGLFEIEHVAGLRKEGEASGRQMLFQEQARLDAGVVLVAAND